MRPQVDHAARERRQNNRHIQHDKRHVYPASVVNFALGAEESGLNRKLSRAVINPPALPK